MKGTVLGDMRLETGAADGANGTMGATALTDNAAGTVISSINY